jgi:hypothetical protein
MQTQLKVQTKKVSYKQMILPRILKASFHYCMILLKMKLLLQPNLIMKLTHQMFNNSHNKMILQAVNHKIHLSNNQILNKHCNNNLIASDRNYNNKVVKEIRMQINKIRLTQMKNHMNCN